MNQTKKTWLIIGIIIVIGIILYLVIGKLQTTTVGTNTNDPYVDTYVTGNTDTASTTTPAVTTAQTAVATAGQTNSSSTACTAAELQGSSVVQPGATTVATITLKVRPDVSPCTLTGFPQVNMSELNSPIATSETTKGSSSTITLKAGESATFTTTWSNWCGVSQAANLAYKVTIGGGYVLIPAQMQNGTVVTNTPSCTASQIPSNIEVSSYLKS